MGERILIIEDDAPLREWVSYELEAEGHEISLAPNGLAGLNAARSENHPDLILLDVGLPGMNGFQVCKALQEDPFTASIPIIFLTARTTLDDKLIGFASGGVDYLTKPFKMAELKARVRAVLHRRDVERQRAQAGLETFKRNLSDIMSHELRTPITKVMVALDLMSQEIIQKRPARLDKTLERAQIGAHELHWLIEDLLLMAQISESDLAAFRKPTDLVQSLEFIREQVTSKYEDKELDLDVRVPDECSVNIMSNHLRHILHHLMDNSCKFSPSGGRVEVIATPVGEGGIKLYIKDRGPGVETELRERIFEKFFQADMSETRLYGGLGLGLYIARVLARAYGGDVTVESRDGQGSTFCFSLPGGASDWRKTT
jgi:signal transduction histidine kinase